MRTTIATKREVIDFEFECPHCYRHWMLSNDTDYEEPEYEYIHDLLTHGRTDIYNCKCGKDFDVETKEEE